MSLKSFNIICVAGGIGLMQFVIQNGILTFTVSFQIYFGTTCTVYCQWLFFVSLTLRNTLTLLLSHVTSSLQAVKSLFEPYCCDVFGEFDDVTREPGDRQKKVWARRALRTHLRGALVLRVPEREVWARILTIFCQSGSCGSSCTGSVLSPSEESLQIRVSMIMWNFQRLAICIFWLSENAVQLDPATLVRTSIHTYIHTFSKPFVLCEVWLSQHLGP